MIRLSEAPLPIPLNAIRMIEKPVRQPEKPAHQGTNGDDVEDPHGRPPVIMGADIIGAAA